MSGENLEWKFCQVFGDKTPVDEITEADIISAVEFDETGEYLATGDKGGRMVLFERSYPEKSGSRKVGTSKGSSAPAEYKFYTEFQSHEPEFDYLKSLEIEEKINRIRWCKRQNQAHILLSTNDKTIKLWKVYEKKLKQVSSMNIEGARQTSQRVSQLRIPRLTVSESMITATPRRIFSNAHAYHINSISLNSDGETYISADDLRINLWNLGISDHSFNIVDIKPANMEELTEVITAAEFHPIHCNVFMYSSSRGSIKLGDMRQSALCDQHSKIFEEEENPESKSFFSEIISSISDVKFSRDGRYIVSRDYLTLKIWDVNMEAKPVKSIQIQEYLRPKLCDLYESDCIFDKFETCFSNDGNYVLTGGYHNYFHVFDRSGRNDAAIEASKVMPKKKTKTKTFGRSKKSAGGMMDVSLDQVNFDKKVLHLAWHPTQNILAVAAMNNLYIYNA
eukprot:TRINITY_DN1713_c2_g1_i4.p1 TRINITY_DN1713_c2_g1~~TRINITY_DN1713_c2_g1_i4.p1  ORF type:complete len:450 (-),score=113.87 TRINITY_DN1713_c2_g1_i4:365-1714(-)